MISYVLRKIFLVVGILLVALAVWFYVGFSRVLRAENDVKTQFREVVDYYISMDQAYVIPLLSSGILDGVNAQDLQNIDRQLREIETTLDIDEQYKKLIVLQKDIISFLRNTSLPESFLTDLRLEEWRKNATNLGAVSSRIKSYNEVLSAYNAARTSLVGKVSSAWQGWTHHEYLGIDGRLEEETIVNF